MWTGEAKFCQLHSFIARHTSPELRNESTRSLTPGAIVLSLLHTVAVRWSLTFISPDQGGVLLLAELNFQFLPVKLEQIASDMTFSRN